MKLKIILRKKCLLYVVYNECGVLMISAHATIHGGNSAEHIFISVLLIWFVVPYFFFLHSFICSSNRANGALGTYILNWLGFFVVVVWSFRSHHHSRYSQQSQCERARGVNEPGKQRCTAIVVSPMLASPSLKSLITTTGRSWLVFARTDFVCILHNERQAVALHVHAQLWIVNTRWNWQYVKQGYHDSRTLYGRNWKFANV